MFCLCLLSYSLNLFAQEEAKQQKFHYGFKNGLGASGWVQQYATWYPLPLEKIEQQLSGSYVLGAFLQQQIKPNLIFQLEANYQNIGNTFYHYSPTFVHKIIEYRFAYLQIPASVLMPLYEKKDHNAYFRIGVALNFLIGANKELNDYHQTITHSVAKIPKENLEENNTFMSQTVFAFGYQISSKMSIELVLQTGLNYEIIDNDFCFSCLTNDDFTSSPIVQTNRNLQLVLSLIHI